MKVDVMTPPMALGQIRELASAVADSGFSGLVLTETGRTAYLSCAAAAMTADIDILTGIAVAFPRSPMITAQVAWELAEATGGRFRLGVGTQVRAHVERRYASDFDPPGPRLREYVEALRAIFRAFRKEERLQFEGRFWSFSLLPDQWSPGSIAAADPPIDVAAVNPWMLRMAGRVADGVHVHPLNTPDYLDTTVRPSVAAGAAAAGRDAAGVQLIVPVFTVVGDTEEERRPWRDMARMQVAFYGSTPNYAFIFDQLGFEGTTARIRERQKEGDIAGMAAVVTDDILDHFAVTAAWDELSDRLIERCRDRADRIVLYFASMAWSQDPSALARYGEVARDVIGRTAS